METKQVRPVRTILVGIGLTPESVGGVVMAKWLAGRLGAALHAVHVIEMVPGEQEAAIPGLARAVEEQAREELELFAATHGLKGEGAVLHVAVGSPEGEILRVVGEVGADLLVMGRYGRGGPRPGAGGGLGSVADRVVRSSPVSVLVADPLKRGEFERIGAATDFSEDSEYGVVRAVELARAMGVGEVVLVHGYELPRGYHRVMTEAEAGARLEEVARARAASLSEKLCGDGRVRLRLVVGQGAAGVVVPELARREGVDLLVLNTHGRSRAASYVLGRKTEKILDGSGCSVWAEKSAECYQGLGAAMGQIVGG